MYAGILICLCLQLFFAFSQGQCVRDTYTNLPPLPAFPSSQYSGSLKSASEYTKNHWSQMVTLPRPSKSISNTQTDCPHLDPDLVDWHNETLWGGSLPKNESLVTIPANTKVLISSCSIDPSFVFGFINIPKGSLLVFGDAPITFKAKGMLVDGGLAIGSPTCRLRNKITITLHGKRNDQTLPAQSHVKGISVQGTIDIHGVEYFPTWTRLAITASPNDTTIFVQDCPNWQPGQKIAITTTELKDSRDWHRNEEATIEKVETTSISSTVCAITLTAPLSYQHYGGSEYQAEVALLSRNILIQGDESSEPTDTSPVSCTYQTNPSTYPCDTTFMTGFGAHVIVQVTATHGRFSGVELFRVGQTNQLGRYPIHFHLLGTLTTPNKFFASDCSVHRSYFRCYSVHGTAGSSVENGVLLTKNTGYDVIGHCFFVSEDGIEENHTVTYNFAGHVHPIGPFWQASYGITDNTHFAVSANGQSFWSQYTDYITNNDKLLRVDDLTASPFYFTNAYSVIEGNAASGGWSGYSFPNCPKPMGDSFYVNNFSPKNRPLISFKGNSAHSTGHWQGHAAGVYLGGNLETPTISTQRYTAGRFLPARDTCTNSTYGSTANSNSCPEANLAWLKFYDTKVFLSNIGIQSWGDREEIIRFEVHDVQLSTNVFGQVWIDQMLVNCRSNNNLTFIQGCNTTKWWTCNARDTVYHSSFLGFEFYDTAQSHLVTNSIFQNCRPNLPQCFNGKCTESIWSYLTHSDQFTPGLMQMTKNITYINVDMDHIMKPTTDPEKHITVAGRDANWLDADGTVIPLFPKGTKVNIGSNWTGPDWWRFNDECVNTQWNWICPMKKGDDVVSLMVHWAPESMEKQIGSQYCSNGGNYKPCPIGAYITHFNRDEFNAFEVALMSRVTGPVIASSGGWFIRFPSGTPKVVKFTDMQIDHDTVLQVAIPYPRGTGFKVYAQAPTWCNPGTPPYKPWNPICQHFYRPVNSIAEVRSSWGDTYFYDTKTQLLHVRIIALDSFGYSFGTNATAAENEIWNSTSTTSKYFSRGGLNLLVTGSSFWSVIIEATSCPSPSCPPVSATVPGVNGSPQYTGPPQTPTSWNDNLTSMGTNINAMLSIIIGCVLFIAYMC